VVNYEERIAVPVYWWPLAAVCVALLGAEIHVGFGPPVAVGTYLVLGGILAAVFVSWGARIRVADGTLQAGRARLALHHVGQVHVLSAATARQLRGDRQAFIVARPYLSRAVRVELRDPDDPVTYWLVFTRRPDALAAAITAAREPAGDV